MNAYHRKVLELICWALGFRYSRDDSDEFLELVIKQWGAA